MQNVQKRYNVKPKRTGREKTTHELGCFYKHIYKHVFWRRWKVLLLWYSIILFFLFFYATHPPPLYQILYLAGPSSPIDEPGQTEGLLRHCNKFTVVCSQSAKIFLFILKRTIFRTTLAHPCVKTHKTIYVETSRILFDRVYSIYTPGKDISWQR